MKYAIVEVSGRQFWIETGKFYDFNRISLDLGKFFFQSPAHDFPKTPFYLPALLSWFSAVRGRSSISKTPPQNC